MQTVYHTLSWDPARISPEVENAKSASARAVAPSRKASEHPVKRRSHASGSRSGNTDGEPAVAARPVSITRHSPPVRRPVFQCREKVTNLGIYMEIIALPKKIPTNQRDWLRDELVICPVLAFLILNFEISHICV